MVKKTMIGNQKRRLLELLRRYSYEHKEVTLSSGHKSDFYIDCRKTVLTAEGHLLTGYVFNQMISENAPKVVAVGGVSVGADSLVSATSTMSTFTPRLLDGFYIRKEPKGHGNERFIEGRVPPGCTVAILEDVITTGGSTIRAVVRAQAHGLNVTHVFVLVDRGEFNGRANVEATGVSVHSVFKRSDF